MVTFSSRRAPLLAVILGVAAAISTSSPASASFFTALGEVSGVPPNTSFESVSGDSPVSVSTDVGLPGAPDLAGHASVVTGAGSVGATARATVIANGDPDTFTVGARSIGTARFSDIVISGPAPGDPFIPVKAHLSLSGTFETSATAHDLGADTATSTIALTVKFGPYTGPSTGTSSDFTGTFTQLKTAYGPGPSEKTGLLADYTGTTFTTPTPEFLVRANTAFNFFISLEEQVSAIASLNGFADSLLAFEHTLSFPTSGPVFDVPAGFTVTSDEAGIHDNAFGSPAAPVPEPGTMALVGGGLSYLLLPFARRWRRARAVPPRRR